MAKPLHSFARITTITTIRRIRELPIGAVSKTAKGQPVDADDVIAAAEAPENHRLIKAASILKVEPEKLHEYLQKHEGDLVEPGQVIAVRSGFMGLGRKKVVSPVDGKIARIRDGIVIIEAGRKRMEVKASVTGLIVDNNVADGRLIVESTGTLIQAAWGHGKMASGTLVMMDDDDSEISIANRFNVDHRGAIVAFPGPLTEEFLNGAIEIKVKGIIAASMRANLIPVVQQLEFPVILTQGFGEIMMSQRILSLFNTYNGREAIVDVSENADWRNQRAEIIIPLDRSADISKEYDVQYEVKKGGKIRILQSPYMGEIGVIKAIPDEVQHLESGLWLPGVMVEVADEQTIFVPFANLEYLG